MTKLYTPRTLYTLLNIGIAAYMILLSVLVLQQAHAQLDSPSAQMRSGVPPEEVQCNEGLLLVIRHGGDPACVREATAERLGLEPLRGAPAVYVPSDMTKANPDIEVTPAHAWVGYSHISQYAHEIVYTLEGTVTTIQDPILWVQAAGFVTASIPITLSVEKVHKGNLESDQFTFFVTASPVFVDGRLATSFASLGEELHLPHDFVIKDFAMDEISNSTDIRYRISDHSDQYEVGEKVIVHLVIYEDIDRTLSSGESVMISDGNITPYYTTPMGNESVYKIQDGLVFDHAGSAQQYDVVVNESRAT